MAQPSITDLYRILYDHAPETLTHPHNLREQHWFESLAWKLKVAGWDWRDHEHIFKFLKCALARRVIRCVDGCWARWRRP